MVLFVLLFNEEISEFMTRKRATLARPRRDDHLGKSRRGGA